MFHINSECFEGIEETFYSCKVKHKRHTRHPFDFHLPPRTKRPINQWISINQFCQTTQIVCRGLYSLQGSTPGGWKLKRQLFHTILKKKRKEKNYFPPSPPPPDKFLSMPLYRYGLNKHESFYRRPFYYTSALVSIPYRNTLYNFTALW